MIKDLTKLNYFKTNLERLIASAYACKDTNQHGQVEQSLGCAESVSNVIDNVIPFKGSPSTAELFNILNNSKQFTRVKNIEPGVIILSPTGLNKLFNNPDIPNGHVGIVGFNNDILSNNSATGLFDIHYTIDSWIKRYRVQGGYKIYLFKIC